MYPIPMMSDCVLFPERNVSNQSVDVILPNHMESNPIYDQADGIYEVIMHRKNITPLGVMTNGVAPNGQMPCSNHQLHKNGPGSFPPRSTMPASAIVCDMEGDEYVQMSSLTSKHVNKCGANSPRYTETPGTTCTTKGESITDLSLACEAPPPILEDGSSSEHHHSLPHN